MGDEVPCTWLPVIAYQGLSATSSKTLLMHTAAVKSLHSNLCIAVHCSIPFHPQLPWDHESAHHWGLRDQA